MKMKFMLLGAKKRAQMGVKVMKGGIEIDLEWRQIANCRGLQGTE